MRQTNRLSGSTVRSAALSLLDIWYNCEFIIMRCIVLMLQPRATNSYASQSSSSGCDGGSPIFPKLLGVRTMPSPKWCCQMRFTMTRAVRGFSDAVSHSANPRRRQVVLAPVSGAGNKYSFALATESTPGVIREPLASNTPRCRKYDATGSG